MVCVGWCVWVSVVGGWGVVWEWGGYRFVLRAGAADGGGGGREEVD